MIRFIAFALFFCLAGCSKTADDLAANFDNIQTGMTIGQVERRLGPGEVIAEEKLPANFKKVYTVEAGMEYRKWTRVSGQSTATLLVAVKDGKITPARLVEKVDIKSGQ